MSKQSPKPEKEKNIYQKYRDDLHLTRAQANELMNDQISTDRLDHIERLNSLPRPEEILAMSKAYKAPELCNYYCTHECSMGKQYMEPVEIKQLQQITLEILSNLNSINKDKNIFIDITADGEISEEELSDFKRIKEKLEQISSTVDSLKLWIEKKGV